MKHKEKLNTDENKNKRYWMADVVVGGRLFQIQQ